MSTVHWGSQCWKFPQVRRSEADNFGGGPEIFCWFFFNFMSIIWDSMHEDLQLFWLSLKHWGSDEPEWHDFSELGVTQEDIGKVDLYQTITKTTNIACIINSIRQCSLGKIHWARKHFLEYLSACLEHKPSRLCSLWPSIWWCSLCKIHPQTCPFRNSRNILPVWALLLSLFSRLS